MKTRSNAERKPVVTFTPPAARTVTLKQVPVLGREVPPAARDQVAMLAAALADRDSRVALLMRGVQRCAEKATRRLVAAVATGPTYKTALRCPLAQGDGPALVEQIAARRLTGATLFVSLRPPPGARPKPGFEAALENLALYVHAERPDIKLVFATRHAVLRDVALTTHVETRNLRAMPWDLAAESHRLRAAEHLERHGLQMDADAAAELFAGMAAARVDGACKYARLLRERQTAAAAPAAAAPRDATPTRAETSPPARTDKRATRNSTRSTRNTRNTRSTRAASSRRAATHTPMDIDATEASATPPPPPAAPAGTAPAAALAKRSLAVAAASPAAAPALTLAAAVAPAIVSGAPSFAGGALPFAGGALPSADGALSIAGGAPFIAGGAPPFARTPARVDDGPLVRDAVHALRANLPQADEERAENEAFAVTFLQRPQPQKSLSEGLVAPPPALLHFLRALSEPAALRAVVPRASRTLLISGPPGTGKTHAVRLLAAELGYPLLAPKSSALMSAYIGEGAQAIYSFFDGARALAVSRGMPVIVYLDEMDALFKRREADASDAEKEYQRVTNALLETMDGIDPDANAQVILIGSTNLRGEIDASVRQRFAFQVEMPLPDAAARAALLWLQLEGCTHRLAAADVTVLAADAKGVSGRGIRMALEKAGMAAYARAGAQAPACIEVADVRAALREVASEADTTWVQKYLLREPVGGTLADTFAGVPPEIEAFIAALRRPEALRRVVPRFRSACLLHGPAGTGKTTLARAVGEALQVPVFAPPAAALISKWAGETAGQIERLFREARTYAQAHDTRAIVFLDELDGLGGSRGSADSGEARRMVNSLLEAMAGVEPDANERLIVMGATNLLRAIDPALTSRFSMQVEVPLPKRAQLEAILAVRLRTIPHCITAAGIERALGYAGGFSGRDICTALDSAGHRAARVPGVSAAAVAIDDAMLLAGVREVAAHRERAGGRPPPGMYV